MEVGGDEQDEALGAAFRPRGLSPKQTASCIEQLPQHHAWEQPLYPMSQQ